MISFKKNFLFYFLLLFTFYQFNFFTNTFIILKNNYPERMLKYGGHCGLEGYGYISYLYNKYSFSENFVVRNFNDLPNIHGYFFDINKKKNDKFVILIGANNSNLNNFIKKGYSVKEKYNNCYLIIK